MTTIIVAMTRSGIIGKGGGLPWRLPEEMGHFKRTTMGHTLLMGRKTYESIGRPLPGRETIVVSRTLPEQEGVRVCRSLEEGLAEAGRREADVFVAGGAEVYRQALPLVDRLLVTYVDGDYEGETVFPEIESETWRVVQKDRYKGFEVVEYRRQQLEDTAG